MQQTATSFRLTEQEQAVLERLARRFGGRAAAFRAALALLDEKMARLEAMDEAIAAFEAELGTISPLEVEQAAQDFGL